MPLYDYGCRDCDTEKEVQHTVSEIGNIEVLCDVCGKPMKKLLSVPALIGFDNIGRSGRRKDNDKNAKKTSPSKKESPTKTTSKADTKNNTAA